MRRSLWFYALGMLCVVSPLACTRTDQAELAKARADTEAAKAEATKARAEADGFRAKNAGGGTAPPAVNPTTSRVKKGGLGGTGVAVFPGGNKRPFTSICNVETQEVVVTVLGQSGGGEVEVPFFKFQEILPRKKGHRYLDNYKERNVRLDDLSRISFGLKKLQHGILHDGQKWEESYCEVELEARDGKKESFPCSLNSLFPRTSRYPPTISVQYADGIGKEKLVGDQLYGTTFRAGE